MIKINQNPLSFNDPYIRIPSGISMTFKNGNTISIQFGCGNYSSNKKQSKSETSTAEIAIINEEGNFYSFGGDEVKGWCDADDVAYWIDFAAKFNF